MIRIFEADETNFNHNETVIKPYYCEVEEVANGMYELELQAPLLYKEKLIEWNIIKAPTPSGEQLFRIYKPFKTLDSITVYARHIFYDLNKHFIDNIRPTDANGTQVLTQILNGTKDSHDFTAISDVEGIHTANYVRKSPVEAIISGDNAVLNRWGGFLERDNFNIKVISDGIDNGYQILYGKNLKGIEIEVDLEDVVTRVMPTWVDDNNSVKYLPERYIESDLIGNYPFPITKELRLELNENLRDLELNDLYDHFRNYVNQQFENGLDKPKINIAVDFVELSKTEKYKNLKFLEKVKMHDVVSIKVDKLNLNLKANVTKYVFDSLGKKYLKLEIGTLKSDLATAQKNFIHLEEKITSEEFLKPAINNATALITGNKGGYVVLKTDANNKPYEILIMDTENIETATKIWRWNNSGLGFSNNGYSGPYNTAVTNDGKIVADFITAGILNANVIRAGAIEGGNVSWNLDTGSLNINNDIIYDPLTNKTTITNGIITSASIANATINSAQIGTLDARYFTLNGVTLENFINSKISTSGFEFNNNGNFNVNGSSVAFNGNSSYLTIKDTGGRGQVDVNGTIAAKGSGYFYELNAGGLKLNQSETAGVRNNGGAGELHTTGGASVKVSGGDVYLNNRKVIFDASGNLKWS